MNELPVQEYEQESRSVLRNTPVMTAPSQPEIKVGLLTGGSDRHYAFGLATALVSENVRLDVIGSDRDDSPEMHSTPGLNFRNLHGSTEKANLVTRLSRIAAFYLRLIQYAATSHAKVFHILWNNKIQFIDRTLLMLYYKLLGKKVVFTAHNVNAGRRDASDSLVNRLTLQCQYRLSDHIFVHTAKMKSELLDQFGVHEARVTVIPFGINNAVPNTGLTSVEAKRRLGIREDEHTILYFGAIKPYKGLQYLVTAFQQIAAKEGNYRLIIAGERKKGNEKYWDDIQQTINCDPNRENIIQKIEFIPDEETELYFKAADVLALPYTEIFQSGVLFLAYSFGLPVIATDVGSFGDDIIVGKTGFLCKPLDAGDLAKAIETYFASDLFKTLDSRRQEIRDYANSCNSWQIAGQLTRDVYAQLLGK